MNNISAIYNFSLKKISKFACLFLFLFTGLTVQAQEELISAIELTDRNGWELEVRAGVNIGGASPLSLPQEIRKIDSYSPRLNATLEGVATKWFGPEMKWGVSAGLKFEEKGMITGAKTKAYHMEIINDGSKTSGYWTGYVKTHYNSTFLSIPIMANYRINNAWKIRAGIFTSFRLDGEFAGKVSDGYLREGDPTGEKVSFDNDKVATYDFSSNLNHFNWGAQIGGSWNMFRHFTLNADLTWGFKDIFESSFKTISFNMYPIYMNIGFGYKF